jgi:hypothetical protein
MIRPFLFLKIKRPFIARPTIIVWIRVSVHYCNHHPTDRVTTQVYHQFQTFFLSVTSFKHHYKLKKENYALLGIPYPGYSAEDPFMYSLLRLLSSMTLGSTSPEKDNQLSIFSSLDSLHITFHSSDNLMIFLNIKFTSDEICLLN